MLYKQLASVAILLSSAASATHLHERHAEELVARGGYGAGGAPGGTYKFAPTTQTATGDTCAAAFGGGYETCREQNGNENRLCYNPGAGQQCCSASWSCPNGSFCMAGGTCCPNGMDASDCAAAPASSTSSSAAATTSSEAAITSSYAHHEPKSHNSTSSAHKSYPTTLDNATAIAKPTGGPSPLPSTTAPVSPAIGSASHASLSVVGLVGAGLIALLATF